MKNIFAKKQKITLEEEMKNINEELQKLYTPIDKISYSQKVNKRFNEAKPVKNSQDETPIFSEKTGGVATFNDSPLKKSHSTNEVLPNKNIKEPTPILPKWYIPFARKKFKFQLVKKYLEEYATPKKLIDGKDYVPDQQDIKEYGSLLRMAKLKDLVSMGEVKEFTYKLDLFDRIKSIDKKKHAAVTIINDNGTLDTFVVHIYDRTFKHKDMCYIILPHARLQDPEIKMCHFFYYANNEFPIIFKKNTLPQGLPDAGALADTINFEALAALAEVDLEKRINLAVIIGVLSFICSIATLLVCLRGFKMI